MIKLIKRNNRIRIKIKIKKIKKKIKKMNLMNKILKINFCEIYIYFILL